MRTTIHLFLRNETRGGMTVMKPLLPLLIMIGIIFLIILFLVWKRNLFAKKPRKTEPAVKVVEKPVEKPVEAFRSPSPEEKEGFDVPKTARSNNFKQWSGPSILFIKTSLDKYYDEYAQTNLQPTQAQIDAINALPVEKQDTSKIGGALNSENGQDKAITSIPWDADNSTSLQKDIVWGNISEQASKSIFIRSYHSELLSDPTSLINYPESPNVMYRSLVLDVSSNDPSMTLLLTTSDAISQNIGQAAMTSASNAAYSTLFSNVIAKREAAVATASHETRLKKIAGGIALTLDEQAEHKLFSAKKAEPIKFKEPLAMKTEKVGVNTQLKLGVKKAGAILKNIKDKMLTFMTKFLSEFLPKFFTTNIAVTATIDIMAAQADVDAAASFGILAVFAAIIDAAAVLWNITSELSMNAMIALQILLPTLLDNAYAEGSTCTNGKPFDALIEDPFLYWLVTNLLPIGMVFDCFGPYVCYTSDGSIQMKTPIKIPSYFSDPTLSVYMHTFPPSQQISSDTTKYVDVSQTFDEPSKWKLTAGIWRKDCDPGTWTSSDVDMLCNITSYVPRTYAKGSKVPATNVKSSRVPQTSVKGTYITTYYKGVGSCTRSGDIDWGLFCTGQSCNDGYDFVAGVCWQRCSSSQTDVGALCRDNCDPGSEYEVLGVCWKACPAGTVDVGALCRDQCGQGSLAAYKNDVAGVCWSDCGSDIDVGALCREKCKDGFHEVAGVCWGNTGTYARPSAIPGTVIKYSPGYIPPSDTANLSFPVCDFASETMLNRMAQFYYDQSSLHAQLSVDGTQLSYEYIVMIYAVIASSELSCDIACYIKTVTFDAITGDNYQEKYGTTYEDDPGNNISYRRFYFIYNPTDTDPKTGNVFFQVTGCTNSDYTAPNAQVHSTDPEVDPPISVRNIYGPDGKAILDNNGNPIKPKIFDAREKSVALGTWDNNTFLNSLVSTGVSQGLGMAAGGAAQGLGGGFAGMLINTGAGVAGGYAGTALANLVPSGVNTNPNTSMACTVIGVGDPHTSDSNYFIATNNDNWSINHGPIYEQVARDHNGFVPVFDFCKKVITSDLLCTNQYIVRDTVNAYQKQNPNLHVKTIYEIEPRGKDGCFYKWDTVSYDPTTNTEGTALNKEEIVKKYIIQDTSTCVYAPLYDSNNNDVFTHDLTNYPIRSYVDPLTKLTVYPTKQVTSTPTYAGRYIRIRPSQLAVDQVMQISQIAVYDSTGANLALNKNVYATSMVIGSSAPPSTITNGNLVCLTGTSHTYKSTGSGTDYLEIDLGQTYLISKIVYYGVIDNPQPSRNNGIRIQILDLQSGLPVKELTTTTIATLQTVDFTTKTLAPLTPSKPFAVPQPLPPDTILSGSCISRCQDKPQIDAFVSQYNTSNGAASGTSKQIFKVLRAATPANNRCDYEVEMVTKDAAGNNIFSKELLSSSVTLTGSAAGPVYTRYIRVATPVTSNPTTLSVMQITVSNSVGTNIALGASVMATSKNPTGSAASVVIDGIGASTWTSMSSTSEHLDIDLGQIQAITSIIYKGAVGARIQLLNDTLNTPVDVTTISQTTQTITFNKCTYNYSATNSTGTFIQSTTPYLEAVDTSGGVFTFASIGAGIINLYNSIVNPINTMDPTTILMNNVLDAENKAKNIMNIIGENQTLEGCPTTKCSDPSVLASIMRSYNTINGSNKQYGRETHTMKSIAQSGISSPNTCDVMFTDLYELYDDYLYEPVISDSTLKVQRFRMSNMAGCDSMIVTSMVDLSSNKVTLSSSAVLPTPYTLDKIQVDCRSPALIAKIKAALPTTAPAGIPRYTSILQSFQNGSTCEYMMSKDITVNNNKSTSDVYISVDATASTIALNEYDPDAINSTTDSAGNINFTMNGVPVTLPFLFNYDNTNHSTRVNDAVQIL